MHSASIIPLLTKACVLLHTTELREPVPLRCAHRTLRDSPDLGPRQCLQCFRDVPSNAFGLYLNSVATPTCCCTFVSVAPLGSLLLLPEPLHPALMPCSSYRSCKRFLKLEKVWGCRVSVAVHGP